MTEFIILPGIGGSGSTHWQTFWEMKEPHMRRFSPASWDKPQLDDWCIALDEAVAAANSPPVLVAHSLACLLVAHWSVRSTRRAKGAFLVSVPDPAATEFPKAEANSFIDAPKEKLRFPSFIVASSDDPYGALAYQQDCAAAWGSDFVDIGACGHMNGESGLADWPAGRQLLETFEARL
ncbi:alpha/beta hydrolase [Notoacmeibacter sp. MSK16QG-6]|uniref:RBBP9/YdeN family alpha/beta hydrolase n=1 Tax=Notoacmeibacter sp. MSK16QG-6 TaxID=2957982 RepID=UPI00209D8902|nr:alpha/beta hydrolase [Notoacmeibacter sp. MSK16QG-6]MCP1199041.1 alpha/beta hydrolase [Notoacmeibacter sp. MSK16QG-6]